MVGRTYRSPNRRRDSQEYLQEQMHKLMRLIKSDKFSPEKRIALEMKYCWFQRDLNILESYQKMRAKNAQKRSRN